MAARLITCHLMWAPLRQLVSELSTDYLGMSFPTIPNPHVKTLHVRYQVCLGATQGWLRFQYLETPEFEPYTDLKLKNKNQAGLKP